MTTDQILLFAILGAVFALLVWGRWRYDLVAFAALIAAVLTGVVPTDRAFSGFGHPATVVVALVLVVSRGLVQSGVVELIARHLLDPERPVGRHIAIMAGLAAILSAVMNNVAALALLMPLDLEAARRAGRPPGTTLMPLAFASILGGMITLIGTPPNIVVASYRETALGAPFGMFAFTPVGLAVTAVGLAFVALLGWRLLPTSGRGQAAAEGGFEIGDYVAELRLKEGSNAAGHRLAELAGAFEEADAEPVAILRHGRRLSLRSRLEPGDLLMVQAGPEALERLIGALGLEYAGTGEKEKLAGMEDLVLVEAVVPEGARIVGRTARSLRLLTRHGVALVGVSRQGQRLRQHVRNLPIRAGDVLLLLGPEERLAEVAGWLGCLPLADRGLTVIRRERAGLAVLLFGGAILLAGLGLVYLPVALAATAVLMTLSGILPLRSVYESIEWPVIVLLGSMIPIGEALQSSGGTALLAASLVDLTAGWPPLLVLAILMVVTMTLSDVMNNTATAVIAAPVAIDVAARMGSSPDPFLMAVAVGASCAFLTPIGHKNNTLIMGPGGYRFGDYWRMGLPLEILVLATAVPAIALVWPF